MTQGGAARSFLSHAGAVYQVVESSTHAFLDGLKPQRLLLNGIQE